MGPATGLSCPHSLVADGPLEADALLALEEALRVDLGLDRLELREAVRAPGVLLHGDALLLALGVREPSTRLPVYRRREVKRPVARYEVVLPTQAAASEP